jgi:hypothetical protein
LSSGETRSIPQQCELISSPVQDIGKMTASYDLQGEDFAPIHHNTFAFHFKRKILEFRVKY